MTGVARMAPGFHWLPIVALLLAVNLPLTACSQPAGNMPKGEKKMSAQQGQTVYYDVALFSYQERPIFDVFLNGKYIGVAAGQPHRGEANGLMTGVPVKLGPQVVTWRLDGVDANHVPFKDNGNTVKAVNIPELNSVDPQFRYLGVHIYPDNTVELIPERYWPDKTEKGEAINRAWEQKHGQ